MREDERGVDQDEEHDGHRPDKHSRAELIACVHHELAAAPTEGSTSASSPGCCGVDRSWFEQGMASTQNIGAGVMGGQG